MMDTDDLVKGAETLTSGLDLPRIWGPTLERNLRLQETAWPYEYKPAPKPRFRFRIRQRIATFLHDLSEKFEECGYRDY